jgi:hypothetical protein
MELTDAQKSYIKNLLAGNALIDLISKDVFKVIAKPMSKDFMFESKCECCGGILKEDGKEKYRAAIARYHEDTGVKHQLFKYTCCIETGLQYGTTPTNKAFQIAWSRGKSAGLHEVFYELQELAELLQVHIDYDRAARLKEEGAHK